MTYDDLGYQDDLRMLSLPAPEETVAEASAKQTNSIYWYDESSNVAKQLKDGKHSRTLSNRQAPVAVSSSSLPMEASSTPSCGS